MVWFAIMASDLAKRRYEVFLSSTFEDLRDIRDALIHETIAIGHFPQVMEHFTAETTSDQHFLRARISQADIFVILIGARYGSSVRKGRGTFTQLEYDTALTLNKPILAFVLNEEEFHASRSGLAEGHPERFHDAELRKFRERVLEHQDGHGRIAKFFSLRPENRDQLIEAYQRAIGNAAADVTPFSVH